MTMMPRTRTNAWSLYTRFWTSETAVMVTMAILVGLWGGFGAVLFRWLIGTFQQFFFGTLGEWLSFAPIAGVIFALEVILAEFGLMQFIAVVVASVVSSVIGRIYFGDVPAFPIPSYAPSSAWELPVYAVLGGWRRLSAWGSPVSFIGSRTCLKPGAFRRA